MKKFLILNSPIFWDKVAENEQYLPPIGLGYIATYLDKLNNVEVEIFDCVKEEISVQAIIQMINKKKPDFLSANIFTQNYDIVKYIFENINIKCKCFIGGQAVKNIFNEILEWDSSNDINIIIGEGEFIIPTIVAKNCIQKAEISNKNKNVYRVDNYSPYFPKDISDIELNRKFLKDEIITNHYGELEASIITSRGCIYNCAFCGGATSLNKDVTVRLCSRESIFKQINEIIQLYPKVSSIRILDDLFLRNNESFDTAIAIFNSFPNITWRGMVHALSINNDFARLQELSNSGCKELFMGIESGSLDIRKRINKSGTIEDVISTATAILSNGIDLKGYFIYGFPNETKDDFNKTFELAQKIKNISEKTVGNFRVSVFQFRPYHGTQIYNEIINSGIKIHKCKFTDSVSQFKGRNQFNFDFGNFSSEPDEILNDFIIKTQKLSENKYD